MLGRRCAVVAVALTGVLAGAVPLPAAAGAGPAYRIIDLGIGDNSYAYAINDFGHVAGYRNGNAFLWRNGRVTDLLPPGGFGSAADVNNRDEVVGSHSVNGSTHAFLWRRGVLTDLGVLPGGTNSSAQAINDSGDIVGWSDTTPDGHAVHAFRWRDGVMTDLGIVPGGFSSAANDVNGAGLIVGNSVGSAGIGVAAEWPPGGTIQPLTDAPSAANAVNDLGDVTGHYFGGRGKVEGFLLHGGALIEIPHPPDEFALTPYGINDRLQIVGATLDDAFLWQDFRLTMLPHVGGGAAAYDINDRGRIVGASAVGSGTEFHTRAVLWTR
jgi:probable HAF family extracellular repeat protein